MRISSLNPAQLMILESFNSVNDPKEMDELMEVLQTYYAKKMEKEMSRLWEEGILDQKQLNELKDQHLRTPYRC